MENLVNLIEALAWPAAVVWLGYLFRSEIRKLLGRVSQLKYKDLEAKFERGLATVEEEARKALPKDRATTFTDEESIYPTPYDEKYEQFLRIAEESPRAALLEAWIEVETSLNEALAKQGITSRAREPFRKRIIDLINTGNYTKIILPLFEDLRGLRNEAAHAPEFIPNKKQTKLYLQLAIELALAFRNPPNGT